MDLKIEFENYFTNKRILMRKDIENLGWEYFREEKIGDNYFIQEDITDDAYRIWDLYLRDEINNDILISVEEHGRYEGKLLFRDDTACRGTVDDELELEKVMKLLGIPVNKI